MPVFSGKLGLQFTTHIANHYSVPELVELADFGRASGFQQVWVNDNLRYRSVLVVLAAMASRVDIDLGTAILVPYFRNPIDALDALVAITELRQGRELSVGMARGDLAQAANQVRATKPVSMVRETVEMFKRLLDGQRVAYRDYPTLTDYFHFNPETGAALAMQPQAPIRFYGGGSGPKILEVAGRIMDGVIVSGLYIPFVRSGRLASILSVADRSATACQPPRSLRKMCELNVALSPDREQALAYAKRYAAHALLTLESMGFTDEEYDRLGIESSAIQSLKRSFKEGATIEHVAPSVPDALARACFVVGPPDEVADEIVDLCRQATAHGFDQVAFAKLGPDYRYTIEGLARHVLPKIA